MHVNEVGVQLGSPAFLFPLSCVFSQFLPHCYWNMENELIYEVNNPVVIFCF